jgi:hypothetical protein
MSDNFEWEWQKRTRELKAANSALNKHTGIAHALSRAQSDLKELAEESFLNGFNEGVAYGKRGKE